MSKISDDRIRDTYEKHYIGRSEPLSVCARKIGCTPQTFANKCRYLSLRLRTSGEGRTATQGQPWTWPDEEDAPTPTQPVEPAAPVEDTAEPQPEPEPPAPSPPGPGKRAVVVHAADFVPAPPERPQWLPGANGVYHDPALADLAHLVRDLRTAGAGVQIALNVELRIGGED